MIFINILLLISSILCQSDDWVGTGVDGVLDYRDNPILRPSDLLEWILGDPTVLLFEEQVGILESDWLSILTSDWRMSCTCLSMRYSMAFCTSRDSSQIQPTSSNKNLSFQMLAQSGRPRPLSKFTMHYLSFQALCLQRKGQAVSLL